MPKSDDQNQDHHVSISITTEAAAMHDKISAPPRLLSAAAGKPTCSIFRVPHSLREVNGRVYNPHIISIGPYRRDLTDPKLLMIEEHKWLYLQGLLARTGSQEKLEELLAAVAKDEVLVRECYSEEIPLSSKEFREMLVLDSCFVVEVLRKANRLAPCEPDDPIFNMAWIVPFLYRDLLRLENQIPFFVLQRVFDLTSPAKDEEEKGEEGQQQRPPLPLLALRFFNHVMQRPEEAIEKIAPLLPRPEHLLDLVRASLIPAGHPELGQPRKTPAHIIHCVSKLRRAGIKLRESSAAETFLMARFRGGVLEMPRLTVDDFMTSFLQNVVAYEQCRNGKYCSKHFTAYTTLLDCLVNTYKDVEYLCDKNIIENCYGNDAEVARFLNNLGKDVAFDIDICYLADLFDDVHSYYKNYCHVQWAGFKYTYFDTPWSFISALAALVLLLLTVTQTLYSVWAFYG